MSERLHLRIPFGRLGQELSWVAGLGVNPEVALQGSDLDQVEPARLAALGRRLQEAGLAATVHAPFHDLNPGALEPLVAEVTRRRLAQTLAVAAELGARLVVCHPGYEYWKYGGQDRLWLEASRRFWPPLLRQAEAAGLRLALENIFETGPEPLATLLDEFDTPWLGHCFDVGHWHLFARVPLAPWFDRLGRHLLHLHLHDNHGQGDDHLLPGEGKIDFPALARAVAATGRTPSLTFEVEGSPDRLPLLRAAARLFSAPGEGASFP